MEKFYIIRADGSSVFELPYPKDFCVHCLILLLNSSEERFELLSSAVFLPVVEIKPLLS